MLFVMAEEKKFIFGLININGFLFWATSPQNALRPNPLSAVNPRLQNVPQTRAAVKLACCSSFQEKSLAQKLYFSIFHTVPNHLSLLPGVTAPRMLHLHPSQLAHLVCQFALIPLSVSPALTRCARGFWFTWRPYSVLLINNYLPGADTV